MMPNAVQVEAFAQFFLGYYAEDRTYKDDFCELLIKNISSISGFWFDCVTSIPWSYMDLHYFLVWPLWCLALFAPAER
jgi:hypothetical protein